MPLPSQVHRDKALENVSVAYKNGDLIADKLCPPVPVQHESDVYYVYSRDQLVVPETARAIGAESNRASFSLSTASYRVQEHALKDIIYDRARKNADPALNLEVDAVEHLSMLIKMREELELANLIATGTAWANVTSLTSTFAWNQNTTLSNPILFADSAAATVIQQSGMVPNRGLINDPTFRAAKEHVSIVDRIKYTSAESVSEDLLAKLMGLPSLLVGRGIFNSGAEGTADATSNSWIWTDMAWFGYVSESAGLKKPSALYNFTLKSGGSTVEVKRWREDAVDGDAVEVRRLFDQQVPMSAAGYLIVNTVQ
jgi:hypothetical protein